MNAQAQLRKLYIAAICASIALIAIIIGADVLVNGWSGLFTGLGGNVAFGLGFWLAAGTVAGLVLGKMDSVVLIANAKGGRGMRSQIDGLIVDLSCTRLGNGMLVQNQIANLWSGVIGLAVVYGICQLLHLITGIAILGVFPGGLIAVFPFVIAWKVVENCARDAIISHYRQRQAKG